MYEKGIEIEDFLEHRDKTEHFLREIVAEASYELDMSEMGCCYNVQMSVMPEGDVSLVISGETPNVGEALSEFGKKLQDFKEIMNAAKKELDKAREKAAGDKTPEQRAREEALLSSPIWIRADSLEHCIAVAKNLHKLGAMESALYKYEGDYYLRVVFTLRERQIAGTILVASEYAVEMFTENEGGNVLIEHGQPICRENAVETLAQL